MPAACARPPQSFRLIMSGSAGFDIKFFSYAFNLFWGKWLMVGYV